jgi:hypothetical protein
MSVTQYTIPCRYNIPKLKDTVYFVSKSMAKIINIDNGTASVTINNPSPYPMSPSKLQGFNIRLNETESLDERYKFTKTLNISILGHLTDASFLMDDDYYIVVEDYEGNFYLINVDFPSKMTYAYTLNEAQNQTDFTFTSNSNHPLLKLNWEIAKWENCKVYNGYGIKNLKLIEKGWAKVDVEQDTITLFDHHTFKDVDFSKASCTLTENYDGSNITNTISFDIPFDNVQSSWQYNLLEFKQNLYIAEILPKNSEHALLVGYENGLQPSYNAQGGTSNGDASKITITLEETSQRGLEELINWSVVENTNKKWVYIKEIDHKNAFTCVGHGLARYDYMAEVDQDGNELGNYKRFVDADASKFPYLNVVGTFDDEVTFHSSVCNCSDEYVYKFNEHYYCVNGDKVQALESIHTYDCGQSGTINGTGSPLSDYTELGDVVESDSDFCDDEVEYMWVLKTDKSECITNTSRWVDVGYACSGETGYDKYFVQKEQVWDVELGWVDTDPLITAATLVEKDSEECGFIDFRKQYLTFIPLDDTTFTCSVPKELISNTFEYSVDSGQTWTEWQVTTPTVTIRAGQKMYIRGVHSQDFSIYGIMGTIHSDGRFNVEGNIMSLIDGVNFSGITDFDFEGIDNGAFQGMFSGSRVVNAENLILPATDLAKRTQFVSNGGIRCYRAMFEGCTELVKAPRELPATTLEYQCYANMFANCTSLTSIPNELPATAITEGCYSSMFEGCTAITESPIIRVERFTWQSVNYYSCSDMFSGCTSLTGITSYIEEPKWRETYSWVKDVAPQGVFRQPSSATTKWGVGDSGIPYGWIVEDIDTHIKYRWTESGTTCIGYDKYKNYIKEQSTDGGQTWTVVIPEVYSPGALIEANSPDCGYMPPTPKVVLTLSDSSIVSANCDSSSALTSGQTSQYRTRTVSAVIYDCVSVISGKTFDNFTKLTRVTIPNTVTNIGYYAFRKCYALASLRIPSSVKNIGDETFKNCSGMTSLTIDTGLEYIGGSAFYNCSGLTSVTLPSSVTKIAGSAFRYCTNLQSITCLATTPPTLSGYYTFDNTNDCPIYVPAASVDAYKTAWNIWNNYYADRIQPIS